MGNIKIEKFNDINYQDTLNLILSKLELYKKMYNDNQFCFNNFNKFSFYNIRAINELVGDNNFVSAFEFNDKLINNIVSYLTDELNIQSLHYGYGGGYPKYDLCINDYCYINLKDKIITTSINYFIANCKYMINQNTKDLTELKLKQPNKSFKIWLKEFNEHCFTYYIQHLFHRKTVKHTHKLLLENYETHKKYYLDTILQLKDRVIELELMKTVTNEITNKFVSLGYRLRDDEF